ncbi:hypothetical protein [Ascidiaceihabitans sp.]|uniref:hypothetical protein n=1 Tax=Ascidiaceihabitans sp. TaxID=1872644 RepID=UPI00329864CD
MLPSFAIFTFLFLWIPWFCATLIAFVSLQAVLSWLAALGPDAMTEVMHYGMSVLNFCVVVAWVWWAIVWIRLCGQLRVGRTDRAIQKKSWLEGHMKELTHD